jgi:hypothetical protein
MAHDGRHHGIYLSARQNGSTPEEAAAAADAYMAKVFDARPL